MFVQTFMKSLRYYLFYMVKFCSSGLSSLCSCWLISSYQWKSPWSVPLLTIAKPVHPNFSCSAEPWSNLTWKCHLLTNKRPSCRGNFEPEIVKWRTPLANRGKMSVVSWECNRITALPESYCAFSLLSWLAH